MGSVDLAAVHAGSKPHMIRGRTSAGRRRFFVILALCLGPLTPTLISCSAIPRVVVPHDPLTSEEHVTLGEAYRIKGLHDAAEKEFQAALKRDSHHIPALIALGNLAFETGALPAAEEFYRRALDEAPDHPQANNNLAMVYMAKGERLDEAESLAKKALRGPATLQPYVLETLASLYLKQGRTTEAAQALDEGERAVTGDHPALSERYKALRAELTSRPAPH